MLQASNLHASTGNARIPNSPGNGSRRGTYDGVVSSDEKTVSRQLVDRHQWSSTTTRRTAATVHSVILSVYEIEVFVIYPILKPGGTQLGIKRKGIYI